MQYKGKGSYKFFFLNRKEVFKKLSRDFFIRENDYSGRIYLIFLVRKIKTYNIIFLIYSYIRKIKKITNRKIMNIDQNIESNQPNNNNRQTIRKRINLSKKRTSIQ